MTANPKSKIKNPKSKAVELVEDVAEPEKLQVPVKWLAEKLIGKNRPDAERLLQLVGFSETGAAEIVGQFLFSVTQAVFGEVDDIARAIMRAARASRDDENRT